jgi:hypothetical protein
MTKKKISGYLLKVKVDSGLKIAFKKHLPNVHLKVNIVSGL